MDDDGPGDFTLVERRIAKANEEDATRLQLLLKARFRQLLPYRPPTGDKCPLLSLPLELRQRIYKSFIAADFSTHSMQFLEMTLYRVFNKQVRNDVLWCLSEKGMLYVLRVRREEVSGEKGRFLWWKSESKSLICKLLLQGERYNMADKNGDEQRTRSRQRTAAMMDVGPAEGQHSEEVILCMTGEDLGVVYEMDVAETDRLGGTWGKFCLWTEDAIGLY